MVLIPESYLKTLPLAKKVYETDTELDNVLKDKNKPDDLKVKEHGELLRKYNVYRDQMTPVADDKKMEDILKAVPRAKRDRAQQILKKIEDSLLTWNKEGEIIFNGRTIHGSHILALLNTRKGTREIEQKEFDSVIKWKPFK